MFGGPAVDRPSRRRWRIVLALAALVGGIGTYAFAQGGAGAMPNRVDVYAGTYDWGNRSYEDEYTDQFEFVNNCDRPVVVTFDSRTVPFLHVMPRVDVAPGKNNIPITLKAPGWPAVPECTDLKGALVVESSGYDNDKGVCHPSKSTYSTTVHLHWWDRPGPPPKLKVAGADACTVWWNTGHPPPINPDLWEEECIDAIRRLAADYRERVLGALAKEAPDQWTWLPSLEAIATMSVKELLAMKARAAAQIAGRK